MEDTMKTLQMSDVLAVDRGGEDVRVGEPIHPHPDPGGGENVHIPDVLIPVAFEGPPRILMTIYDQAPITFIGVRADLVFADTTSTMTEL